MPHVSRVQSGEYPSSAEGARQRYLFDFGIAMEGEREQVDQVLHGTAIEWNFVGDGSVDATGWSSPAINHAASHN
jgi:hypothetical protein